MILEIEQPKEDSKKCPQCESMAAPEWDKFKDLEANGNYFTVELKYCPCCKFIYYSDVYFS